MIAFRDILIFAGLAALAAAVIASLFPVGEGVSAVPACSDCAFKLTGGYWIRQYGNYAALYLGTREVARYGWAYNITEGRPLSVGENATCDTAMYLWVINGIAYVSCDGTPPRVGRNVLGIYVKPYFYAVPTYEGCSYVINLFDANINATVGVYVLDEEGRLVAEAAGTIPGFVSFSVPTVGVYRVYVYTSPSLFEEWHTVVASVRISDLLRAEVFTSDDTQDLRPSTSLKIFDLTNYWKKGYRSVTVRVNPAGASFTLSAPADAFADFLLAWEDCSTCDNIDGSLYVDEVWRLTFTKSAIRTFPYFTEVIVFTRIHSGGDFWHEVYVSNSSNSKTLIWTWNKEGPKFNSYTVRGSSTIVWIESQDSAMNARASFAKECYWG
jgi:hypothetical protein